MRLNNGWSVVYEGATRPDGSLLFPQRLSKEFLENAKRTMGSYLYSNQYENIIVPSELQNFKKHWFKIYTELPKQFWTFAMIDPAIGQKKTSDYTGIVVVSVDTDTNWYVRHARRERMTPTEIINLCFKLQDEFDCLCIGIEAVAYQKALVLMLHEEMIKRKRTIPIKDIHPGTDRTKEMRIRGVLVPRYEFGRIYHSQGLFDLETELLQFPRSAHDDIADALALLEICVTYPEKEKIKDERPHSASDPRYESWYIRNKLKGKTQAKGSEDY